MSDLGVWLILGAVFAWLAALGVREARERERLKRAVFNIEEAVTKSNTKP